MKDMKDSKISNLVIFVIIFLSVILVYVLIQQNKIEKLYKERNYLVRQRDSLKILSDKLSRGQMINFVISENEKIIFCDSNFSMKNEYIRERLQNEITFLLQHQQFLIMLWLRSGRYFPLFESELDVVKMPHDIEFVSLLESGLDPVATSTAKAVGLWQFIQSTGQRYGLSMKNGIDLRRDPGSATKAAVKYLSDLYVRYHSWLLALAAYNCGESRVDQQIREQKTNNYFVLHLPSETRRYVYLVVALKLIFTQPDRFLPGIASVKRYDSITEKIIKVSVEVKKNIKVKDLANLVGVDQLSFSEANPAVVGKVITNGKYTFNIIRK